MEALQLFKNKKIGNMRGYIDDNAIVYLNVEDSVLGLGFTTIDNKGNEKITWDVVRNLLKRFGYNKKVKADDYIPENIFYLLAMKADNDAATNFQIWIANDVIPSIRKTGSYSIKPQIAEQIPARQSQLQARKEAVGVYELYSAYARKQGDTRKPKRIYAKFSNLANRASGIPNGCRELATSKQLKICEMAEKIISQTLLLGISLNDFYADIEESVMLKVAEIMQLTTSNMNLLKAPKF